MQLEVNGESRSVEDGCPIAQLLQRLELGEQGLAVLVNGELIPRATWPARGLVDGDRIEIVRMVGGG